MSHEPEKDGLAHGTPHGREAVEGSRGASPSSAFATKAAGIRVSSVLFVCGMNSIRSPMAEAIAKSLLPASTYVVSAGVRTGERDPFVDIVLEEQGLSLGDRRPQGFEDLADGYFDLIVTMAPEAHHTVLDATGAAAVDVEFWPMPDPSVVTGSRPQILDAYRDVRTRIEARIRERLLRA